MYTVAYHTDPILPGTISIENLLDSYLPTLEERSVVAVTSKVVALCEGRFVPVDQVDKAELVRMESSRYLPAEKSKYGISLSIKGNVLIPTAGIDESNGNGHYVLWPKNSQASANAIREHLRKRDGLKDLGVVITDSTTAPLRYGTRGIGLAHSGFLALRDYRGEPDIFGLPMRVTKASYIDALATSAVVVMGEGREQCPLAVLSDLPFLTFQDNPPTQEEIAALTVYPEDDLYAPLIESAPWLKGEEQ